MVDLICPRTREPLERRGDQLVAIKSGTAYPVVDGIPVLLPDPAERNRIVGVDWAAPGTDASTRLGFYNSKQNNQLHAHENQLRAEVQKAAAEHLRCDGPTLEIGSGGGSMQGIGQPYIALDYGFTALQALIDPRHDRICATAEALPFPSASFALVFSIAALEHVPAVDRAMEEIDRVLKPGGIAFLQPAWHCRQYICDGLTVKPYGALSWPKRVRKFMLPLTDHVLVRAAFSIPRRALRRGLWALGGRKPTHFHFKRLRADYSEPLCADSDACSSLDSHEATLFFQSRDYEIISPGRGARSQLLARHISLIARKPA